MQSLTVITAANTRLLTKNHVTGESYAKTSKLLAAERVDFATLKDLRRLLRSLADKHSSCVIRGELKATAELPIRRRKSHFADVAQAWVMLDIDDVRLPKRLRSYPYTSEHIDVARALMPDAFKSAGCVWQASASAGLDLKKLKVHLWFLLDAPLTAAQLRNWLRGAEHIDPSTLRVVQPHYTADPIGGPDGARLGIVKGPRVTTPTDVAEMEPEAASTLDLEPRPKGSADVTSELVASAMKQAITRARDKLNNWQVPYQDSYVVGTLLGPAVALQTWNDKKHGHETWQAEAERLAAKWGARFGALNDGAHPAEVYEARVLEGITWGVVRERERLAARSAKVLAETLERTKALRESLLAKMLRNAGSPKVLAEVGGKLGRYAEICGREELIEQLRKVSGLAEAQVAEAIDAGVTELPADNWREGLLLLKEEIVSTDDNTKAIFSKYPGFIDSFRINVRSQQLEVSDCNVLGLPAGVYKPEALDLALVGWLSSLGMRRVSMYKTSAVFKAFVETLPSYDPFLEAFPEALMSAADARAELDAMKPRLDTWLTKYFGVEDNELHRAFAAKSLISAVARAVKPGAKVDTLLVLIGEQGLGKTSVVETLASCIPSGYRELLDTRDKDALLQMHSGLLVEVSELRALGNTHQDAIKAFWTRRTDRIRAPYARASEEMPRRVVFIGTTNDDDFLSDRMNRRYWPVMCTIICAMTAKQAKQLWREAALRYATGEQHWLDADLSEQQTEAVARVRHENLVETQLIKYLKNKTKIKLFDAVRFCFPDTREPAKHQRQVSTALKVLKWSQKRTNKAKYWVPARASQ